MKTHLACIFTAFSTVAFGVQALDLKSNSLVQGQPIALKHVFNGFGCTGENVSPALSWSGAPEGTKSYAITMYDPDAPTGSGWWHWVVVNIPASVTSIEEGKVPAGALQTRTDFGTSTYGGPCPPVGHGVHHYHITVHALKVEQLDLNEEASGAMVGYFLNENTLAKASIMGTFERQ